MFFGSVYVRFMIYLFTILPFSSETQSFPLEFDQYMWKVFYEFFITFQDYRLLVVSIGQNYVTVRFIAASLTCSSLHSI